MAATDARATDAPAVLHILEAFTGGAARHLVELLRALPHQRAIVSPYRDSTSAGLLQRLSATGAAVETVRMHRSLRPAQDLQALIALYARIRAIRPTIVHCHSAKAGFLGRAAAALAGVPVRLYTPHGLPFHDALPARQAALYRALERLAGLWTTAVVAVSESEAAEIRRAHMVPTDRIRVIPNGVALPVLAAGQQQEARRRLGLPLEAPVVACVAQLRPQKAPLDWLRMVEQVAATRPDVVFVWAGGGELEPQFRAAAQRVGDKLYYLGSLDDPAPVYAAATVFTMSSLWEGCPYALLDAMAWGLPCAVTAVTGCVDAIENGASGLLCRPGAPGELEANVLRLLDAPAASAKLGAAARATIEQRYRVEQCVEQHAALYRELLQR